jgi:RND family efflux transporter MFP subunit
MPQDQDIFSKWEIIEAQLNAGLAKEKMGFVGQKLKVSKKSAKADLQILSIDKNRALSEIGIAQQTLDSLELKAPKDGLVIYRRERMREPQVGDDVMGGQVLVELVDLSMLEAKIYVLEMDAGQIAKGQPVIVRLDSIPGKDFHGTLKSVASLAMSRERNSPLKYFECEVLVTDAGPEMRRIKPGMALKANVVLDKYDSVFVVPNSSLTFKDGKYFAYTRTGKTFTEHQVKVGSGNHGQTVVLEGLQDNQLLAMRNPFEARKAHLPDFSKAGADQGGRDIRIMMGPGGPGGPGGGGGMRGGR